MNDDRLNDLLEMGVLLAGSGQPDEARAYFTKAVKINAESPFAWYYLGAVMDDPEKKQYCFNRAVALDTDIHSKVARAHAVKPSVSLDTGTAAPERTTQPKEDMFFEDSEIPDAEDHGTEPVEVMRKPPKTRKRISPFWILFSILLLVLAMLAGVAYWILFLR